MQEFKIEIKPENFPAVQDALAQLMSAIFEDAEKLVKSQGMPPVLMLSIMSALCIQMKRELDNQIESLAETMRTDAPNLETQHVTVREDGTHAPLLQPMPTARPGGHLN